MNRKKNILAIIGSASSNSTNLKLVEKIVSLTEKEFIVTIFNDLKSFPHFDPLLTNENIPKIIVEFRNAIEKADGIIICSPEYVFSMPSGLKNAFEWCISTTIFSNKPSGLITASADGQMGHEQLLLIMKTVMAKFNHDTTLLIEGIKGKFDLEGNLTSVETLKKLEIFINSFIDLIKNK